MSFHLEVLAEWAIACETLPNHCQKAISTHKPLGRPPGIANRLHHCAAAVAADRQDIPDGASPPERRRAPGWRAPGARAADIRQRPERQEEAFAAPLVYLHRLAAGARSGRHLRLYGVLLQVGKEDRRAFGMTGWDAGILLAQNCDVTKHWNSLIAVYTVQSTKFHSVTQEVPL